MARRGLQRGPRAGSHNNLPGRKECPTRNRGKRHLTLEQKKHIVSLWRRGMPCSQIQRLHYPDRNTSTISTQYTPENRRKLAALLAKGVSPKESVMSTNRTDNIRDMERILEMFTKQDNMKSIFLTKDMIKHNAIHIHNFLKKQNLYDDYGNRKSDEPRIFTISDYTPEMVMAGADFRVTDLTYTECDGGEGDALDKSARCPLCDKKYKCRGGFKEHIYAHRADVEKLCEPVSPTDKNIFRASNGWLHRFCNRSDLGSRIMYGEKGSADHEAAELYKIEFHNILKREFNMLGYPDLLTFVINFDEFGWVMKSLPARSYIHNNQLVLARKPLRARLSVCVGCTSSGMKFTPMVIGVSKRPRCFPRGVDLPVMYRGQPSAWMTSELFQEYFIEVIIKEIEAKFPGRRVVLTLDQATCHPEIVREYSPDIRVEFLPARTTSLIQPCDQQVIFSLKCTVKKIYYMKMVEHIRCNPQGNPYAGFLKAYTLYEGIKDLAAAWENLPTKIIRSSFNKLMDHKKLKEELPTRDFHGFPNVNLTGVEPGASFIVPLGVDTISIQAAEDNEDLEALLQNSVAELTNIFNEPAVQTGGNGLSREQMFITTDRHVRRDLELDMTPPMEVLHDLANKYILQLDVEDEDTEDMLESAGVEPEATIYDERKIMLQNVLSAQRLFSKHIGDVGLQRQATKHLVAVRELYLKYAPVRGHTVAFPPASTDINDNYTGQVAQADIDLNDSYERALPDIELELADDSTLPHSDIQSEGEVEKEKNVTHFRSVSTLSTGTSAGTSGYKGKGGKGTKVKKTIVKKRKRKEKWDMYEYSSEDSSGAKTADIVDDSSDYSLHDELNYSDDNIFDF